MRYNPELLLVAALAFAAGYELPAVENQYHDYAKSRDNAATFSARSRAATGLRAHDAAWDQRQNRIVRDFGDASLLDEFMPFGTIHTGNRDLLAAANRAKVTLAPVAHGGRTALIVDNGRYTIAVDPSLSDKEIEKALGKWLGYQRQCGSLAPGRYESADDQVNILHWLPGSDPDSPPDSRSDTPAVTARPGPALNVI